MGRWFAPLTERRLRRSPRNQRLKASFEDFIQFHSREPPLHPALAADQILDFAARALANELTARDPGFTIQYCWRLLWSRRRQIPAAVDLEYYESALPRLKV